jgi:hypothetical protein
MKLNMASAWRAESSNKNIKKVTRKNDADKSGISNGRQHMRIDKLDTCGKEAAEKRCFGNEEGRE